MICGLFYEAICFKSCLVLFCSCVCFFFFFFFFSPFSIAITWHGVETAKLSAFRTFVRFALVRFCLFPLPLGVWEGPRLVMWHFLDFSLTFLVFYVYINII